MCITFVAIHSNSVVPRCLSVCVSVWFVMLYTGLCYRLTCNFISWLHYI